MFLPYMRGLNTIFVIFVACSFICSCKKENAYRASFIVENISGEDLGLNDESLDSHSEEFGFNTVKDTGNNDNHILTRLAYTTSYNSSTRNPNWVEWVLTREHTDGPYTRKGVPYYSNDGTAIGIGHITPKTFKNGYFMDMESVEPRQKLSDWSRDYNMSHGHMCPAGDNKWSKAAMNQSFLLTNMCPQDASLNSGSWKKLEEKCRKWAKQYGSITIVAGPIFYETPTRFLGHIAIPDAFFKVVLCHSPKTKAIGFIYENNAQRQSMNHTCCTVNHVEEITGFDFFSEIDDEIEEYIESQSDINDW